MKKNVAILLGALLLPAAPLTAFAQVGMNTDEGKPNINTGPTRELTKMCKAEAKDKKLTGKEKSSFMRDCQANKIPPEGASSTSSSSSGSPGANMKDADGRTQGNVNTSKTSKKPVTNPGASGAGTSTDADGKAKAK